MELVVICPHCQEYVVIAALNCSIFRHGSFITNGQQIPPHATQTECQQSITTRAIYGCGKPFRVQLNVLNTYEAIDCDYL